MSHKHRSGILTDPNKHDLMIELHTHRSVHEDIRQGLVNVRCLYQHQLTTTEAYSTKLGQKL